MNDPSNNIRLLRGALLANAAFSSLNGLGLVLFGGPLARLLLVPETITAGVTSATILLAIGIGLVLFAISLVALAWRAVPPAQPVVAVIAADLVWVAGSSALVIVAANAFTPAGLTILIAVAVVVGALAVAQWRGLAVMRGNLSVA